MICSAENLLSGRLTESVPQRMMYCVTKVIQLRCKDRYYRFCGISRR